MSVITNKIIYVKNNIKPNANEIVQVPQTFLDEPAYGFYIENRTDYDIYFNIDNELEDIDNMYKVDANNWISDDNVKIEKNIYFYSPHNLSTTPGVFVVLYNKEEHYRKDDVNIVSMIKQQQPTQHVNNITNTYDTTNINNQSISSNKNKKSSIKYNLCDDNNEMIFMEGGDDY